MKYFTIPLKRILFIIILLIGFSSILYSQNTLDKVNCIPGTIGGSVNVSPSGAANYSIPIILSPGTLGMHPNLSIVYSSQGGNGLLGWGWNLAGLSSISRVAKNQYYDNSTKSISLTTNDAFMLDGVRLIKVSTGIYYPANNPYTKVTFSNNSFTVTSQDGMVMEYGKEGNSLVIPNGITKTVSWNINRITDPEGNYIQFIYEGSSTTGEYRISEIKYTGNSLTNRAAYNSVKFEYETRTDISNSYIAGGKLIQSVRLTSIKGYCEGAVSKNYGFTYLNTDQYSKLNKITLTADGISYNPTFINWGSTAVYTVTPTDFSSVKQKIIYTGDVNGDGLVDIASWNRWDTIFVKIAQPDGSYISNFIKISSILSDSHFTSSDVIQYGNDTPKIQVLDRNNDGKDEIIVTPTIYNSTTPKYPSCIFTYNNNAFTFQLDCINTESSTYGCQYYYGDFNNDGVTERLTVKNRMIYACEGMSITANSIGNIDNIKFLDFNGNGRTDILTVASDGEGRIWEYSDSTLTFINLLGTGVTRNFGEQANFNLGDFNGDGKTDYFSYDYETASWRLFYSTGKGYVEGTAPNLTHSEQIENHTANDNYIANTIIVEDLNNDGKSDICQALCSRVFLYISTGNGFNSLSTIYTYTLPSSRNYVEEVHLIAVDNNNDGLKELIYTNSVLTSKTSQVPVTTYNKILSLPIELKKYLLVDNITDGLNNKIAFTYSNYTNNTPFSSSFPKPALPLTLVRGPWQLVSNLKTTSSTGDIVSNTNYTYYTGYSHINLDFLGFKNLSSKNLITNVTDSCAFEFTIPNVSGIYYTWLKYKSTKNGDKTSWLSNDFIQLKKFNSTNKSFVAVVTQSTSYNAFSGVTTTKTTGFDEDFGRVNTQTTSVTGWTTTSTNTYETVSDNKSRLKSTSSATTNAKGTHTSTVELTYDSSYPFRLLQKTNKEDATTTSTTTYSYDSTTGFPNGVSVAAGGITRSTTFKYENNYGRFVVESTDVLGNTSKANYRNYDGAIVSEENSLGKQTSYSYSFSNGTLTSTINTPDNNVVKNLLAWDNSGIGLYNSQKMLNGNVMSTTYFNSIGQSLKDETRGYKDAWETHTYTYNPDGTISSQSLVGLGTPTSYGYDGYGRLNSLSGLNTSITYSYSGLSQTITKNGVSTSQTVDPLGNVTAVSGTMGSVTYKYEPTGRVYEIQAADGTTKMEYDASGNQTKLIDPDAGTTTYTYNGFGELLTQTDAKGQTITCTYNNTKGLLLSKTGTNLNESYNYDLTNTGINGRLISASRNNVSETYSYDDLGRVTSVVTTDNVLQPFTTTNHYNSQGQLYQVDQPTGLILRYTYDNAWNITAIQSYNSSTNTTSNIWEGTSKNALDQWEKITLGNNLITKWGYNATTKLLQSIKTGTSVSEASIQNLGFTFNTKGQLTQRTEGTTLTENFVYDNLNRLTSATVSGQSAQTCTYADNGNVNSTSLAGSYSYDATHPHAVGSVAGVSHTGTSPSFSTSSTYTIDNRIATMDNGTYRNTFWYGPSGDRFKVDLYHGTTLDSSKVYVGSSEFVLNSSGAIVKSRTFVYAPTGICAVWEKGSTGNGNFHYIHTDYLGSWLKITNQSGTVENSYSYDAWGRPRNPNTWALMPVSITNALTNLNAMQPRFDRGYTGHEHMAGFGLINMNGRLYDPYLQRFLSPDNFVQDPGNSQNYNRYSYCMNNPLMYTDPSGWQLQEVECDWSSVHDPMPCENFNHVYDQFMEELTGERGGGGGKGGVLPSGVIGGKEIFNAYAEARKNGYKESMEEFEKLIKSTPNNNGGYSITISYWVPVKKNGTFISNEKTDVNLQEIVVALQKMTITINSPNSTGGKDGNSDYTIHYTTETPLPGLPSVKAVTSIERGEGPIHMKSVNGSDPSLIQVYKTGPFTHEIDCTQGGGQSLSLSIGNYYISISSGEETFSVGFGAENGGVSAGYEIEAPTLILQLMLVPVEIEAPVLVPIPL